MRICPKCSKEKNLSEFITYKRKSETHYGICKICHNRRQAAWVANNLEKSRAIARRCYKQTVRNKDLKAAYGITEDDYNLMLQKQNGLCAICKQLPKKGKLHVDHDHSTGKIRALLCSTHNKGLGFFQDSIALLKEAIIYLETFR